MLFEVVNNRHGNSRFTVVIGPCDDKDKRDELFLYMSGKFKNRAKGTDRWSRLYSKSFKIDEDKDEEEQLRKKIEEFVTVTIPKEINPVLETFPGFTSADR